MAAGSVIGALGLTNASIDRMGGFRRAMPFTFVVFLIGAAALAGLPLLSGFFSKDEILTYALERGGLYAVLSILGSVGALLTAFYAFRMVFRVFLGEEVPEARHLRETGEIVHGDHVNPTTGEHEDTDVGFPGPEHHVAEKAPAMSVPMGVLALLAIGGGIVAVPGLSHTLETFLEPTFADSRYLAQKPPEAALYEGLIIGAVIAIVGVLAAYLVFVRRRGLSTRLRDRVPALHRFLAGRWYFDEAYEAVFVRPTRRTARFFRTGVERGFVEGTLIGGSSGLVRAGTSFAKAIQSGYLRAYALLLLAGMGALGLYFLIASL
jgi:NADH-quinone oxidoreductase subunit L